MTPRATLNWHVRHAYLPPSSSPCPPLPARALAFFPGAGAGWSAHTAHARAQASTKIEDLEAKHSAAVARLNQDAEARQAREVLSVQATLEARKAEELAGARGEMGEQAELVARERREAARQHEEARHALEEQLLQTKRVHQVATLTL